MALARRPFLALCGAAMFGPDARRAFAQEAVDPMLEELIEQELAESLNETLPPKPLERGAFLAASRNIQTINKRDKLRELLIILKREYEKKGDRISTWPADERSLDYRHLLALKGRARYSRKPFTLTHTILTRLASANGYMTRIQDDRRVIFGLRGCRIARATNAAQRSVRLVEAIPNHFERRCVLGVWDRRRRTVAVFEGSTVPNRVQVDLHWLWADYERRGTATKSPGLWMTNLLPQGLYEYDVGTHLEGAWPRSRRQPGSLRQVDAVPVLRARNSASYTFDEHWDYASKPVGDNIHASVYTDYFIGFSSQGCQTVAGNYRPRGYIDRGAWSSFRRALGLLSIDKNTQTTGNDHERFAYMLTTGREARLHATAPRSVRATLTRARIGTRGREVMAVQRVLARQGLLDRAPNGHLDRSTAVALIEFQRLRGVPTDAVITPEFIRAFT
ncbi:MAG: peptidoglycan-binding domain-containing protein [Myxococcota bacterium]